MTKKKIGTCNNKQLALRSMVKGEGKSAEENAYGNRSH